MPVKLQVSIQNASAFCMQPRDAPICIKTPNLSVYILQESIKAVIFLTVTHLYDCVIK